MKPLPGKSGGLGFSILRQQKVEVQTHAQFTCKYILLIALTLQIQNRKYCWLGRFLSCGQQFKYNTATIVLDCNLLRNPPSAQHFPLWICKVSFQFARSTQSAVHCSIFSLWWWLVRTIDHNSNIIMAWHDGSKMVHQSLLPRRIGSWVRSNVTGDIAFLSWHGDYLLAIVDAQCG